MYISTRGRGCARRGRDTTNVWVKRGQERWQRRTVDDGKRASVYGVTVCVLGNHRGRLRRWRRRFTGWLGEYNPYRGWNGRGDGTMNETRRGCEGTTVASAQRVRPRCATRIYIYISGHPGYRIARVPVFVCKYIPRITPTRARLLLLLSFRAIFVYRILRTYGGLRHIGRDRR